MRHLLILPLFGTIYGLTLNEKSRQILSKIIDSQFNHGVRQKRQIQTDYAIMPNYWMHAPNNPQFVQMTRELAPLVPLSENQGKINTKLQLPCANSFWL